MAIKLEDCSPSLKAAILRQLEKEGRGLPQTIIRYAVAHYQFGEWKIGPETEDLKLCQRLAGQAQRRSGASAYMAAKGTPTAVVVKLTRTATLTSQGQV